MSLELLVAAIGVGVAMWVDHRWGEPPAWLHPVVAMGRYLGRLGPVLTPLSPGPALVGGGLAWLVGALGVMTMAVVLHIGWRDGGPRCGGSGCRCRPHRSIRCHG
ncbi:MAG: hypothetical protein QM742_09930 [Aquabacterium sp.]